MCPACQANINLSCIWHKNLPSWNGLGGHPQAQAACLQLGLFCFGCKVTKTSRETRQQSFLFCFVLMSQTCQGHEAESLTNILMLYPSPRAKSSGQQLPSFAPWANILWFCLYDSVYNLRLLALVAAIAPYKSAFPSNGTFCFMFVHLARSFRNEVKRSALSFLMGNKHLDLPHLWFQFHDNTEHVTWIQFREAARTQGFTQKWEAHYFSVCWFSWPLVLPALLLMAYWSTRSGQEDVEKWNFLHEGMSHFQNVTWETMLEVYLSSPIWQKDWKCQRPSA